MGLQLKLIEGGTAALPERIGKYAIRRMIGKGAMGTVYEGFDALIGRPVAIKTILAGHLATAASLAAAGRFKHEAQAAGRLHHPTIVGVHEYGEDDETAFIVMEYVDGEPLDEMMGKRGRFETIEIYEMMKQLLAALDHAHRHGIVHCDVKAANVMVLADLKIKLMDFGVARIEDSSQTRAGMTIGTPTHIAPEQYGGQPTDSRVDLWAAGVLLYELLTGRDPFVAETPAAVMHRVMHLDPPPPSSLVAGLPPSFDALLARALAKKADERSQSAREFAKAMVAAFANRQPETPRQRSGVAAPAEKAWPPQTLVAAEAALSRAVGPFARELVRQAAAQAKDFEGFCAQLAEHVPAGDERGKFVRHLERLERASAAPPAWPGGPLAGFDAATLGVAKQRLAPYVGPLAEALIASAAGAAGAAGDVPELYRRLAEPIASPQERAAFLSGLY